MKKNENILIKHLDDFGLDIFFIKRFRKNKYEKKQFRLFNFSEILERAKYNKDDKRFV